MRNHLITGSVAALIQFY